MMPLNVKETIVRAIQVITHDELPLMCPRADRQLWSAHPRVYLPIEQQGQCACPYCGQKYVLQQS